MNGGDTTVKKPLVIHLLVTLETGGTEMALAKALPFLTDFRHLVCSIRPLPESDSVVLRKLILLSHVQARSFNMKRQWSVINVYKELKSLLLTARPLCLVTYLSPADLLGRFAANSAKTPVICFLRSTLREWRYRPWTLLNGLTSGYVHHYLSVSVAAARPYKTIFAISGRFITIIPNGTEIQSYHERKKGLSFGYVSKMRPKKGFETLLPAFAVFAKNHPKARLLLVGDGPLRLKIEKMAARLGIVGQIKFLGLRSDIAEILKSTDIFVFPSLYEGMSNSLLEAMAAGLPIIAADLPENRETIGDDKAAVFVRPKHVDSLAAAMEKLARDSGLRQRLSLAAYRQAVQFHDIKRRASQFQNTLWQIAKNQTVSVPSLRRRLFAAFKRYPLFVIMAGVGFLANLAVTAALTEIFHVFYLFSYIAGTIVNWTINFFLNSQITFRGCLKNKLLLRYSKFIIFFAAVHAVNMATVYLLTSVIGIHYLISIIGASALYSIVTYTFAKNIIFVIQPNQNQNE